MVPTLVSPSDAGAAAGKKLPLSRRLDSHSTSLLTRVGRRPLPRRLAPGTVEPWPGTASSSPRPHPTAAASRSFAGTTSTSSTLRSGRETRLTTSGTATVLNGRLDWVYEEELGSRNGRAFWWSPDSRQHRLSPARRGAGSHLPHRRLPARAQRGARAALSQGGRPECHRPRWASWAWATTGEPGPSASSRSIPTTSTCSRTSPGRRTRGAWPSRS